MSKAATENLVIEQGTTFEKTLELKHACRLARDLRANIQSPPTAIKIYGLPVALPSGYVLSFPLAGCNTVDLVTTASVPAGSTDVSIVPYTEKFSLPCNSSAPTLAVNLMGEVWRGACRKKYDDAPPLFTFTFQLDPLIGRVVVTVPPAATSALALTAKEQVIFSDIPDNYQIEGNFRPEIWAKAWYYDIERVLQSGKVVRPMNGRLWMIAEATK